MQLGRTDSTAPRQTGLPAQRRDADVTAPAGDNRALVALTPVAAPREPRAYREPAFLAHLIATKNQLPQTRERRRVEPGEAIAAYRTTADLTEIISLRIIAPRSAYSRASRNPGRRHNQQI